MSTHKKTGWQRSRLFVAALVVICLAGTAGVFRSAASQGADRFSASTSTQFQNEAASLKFLLTRTKELHGKVVYGTVIRAGEATKARAGLMQVEMSVRPEHFVRSDSTMTNWAERGPLKLFFKPPSHGRPTEKASAIWFLATREADQISETVGGYSGFFEVEPSGLTASNVHENAGLWGGAEHFWMSLSPSRWPSPVDIAGIKLKVKDRIQKLFPDIDSTAAESLIAIGSEPTPRAQLPVPLLLAAIDVAFNPNPIR